MRLFCGHISAFREVTQILIRHRDLIWEMARRDISDRYAGQAFGLLWAVGHPLFMMALFVFIFAFVFKTKVGGTIQMPLDYTTYILAGLIPWMAFQESMNKSCSAITTNASLVKQVVFPLELLPAKGVLASLLPQLVSTFVLLGYVLLVHGGFSLIYLLLPVLIMLQLLAMMGLAYMFAAIGAYFRDIKDFVQMFGMAGVYLAPIVYLPEMVPTLFKPVLYLNPFSYVIWCYQDVIYFGRIEHPYAWIVFPMLSVTIFVVGYRLFRKLKIGFGNVL
jgi:lipopolysaccharide transport system permease protein